MSDWKTDGVDTLPSQYVLAHLRYNFQYHLVLCALQIFVVAQQTPVLRYFWLHWNYFDFCVLLVRVLRTKGLRRHMYGSHDVS